ncbi:MAG: chemotaxis protein CheA [Candidatus Uhrbacteria bacterium]
MSVDISKFKDLFLSEAEEHVQKLNDNLLLLEKATTNKDLLNELMRSSHTIKGSSATMQYTKVAFLTHVMEDVFDFAKNEVIIITPEIITTLYETVDLLEKSLASIKKDNLELSADDQIVKLKKITGVTTEGIGKSSRDASGKPILAKVLDVEITTKKKVSDKPVIELENITAPEKLSHIKVPVERLDNLLNLVEELVIDKMRLEQKKKASPELEEIVSHTSRLISDLQYQVMQVRLVPVEQIFARFPRMVRDLAVAQKKDISFEVIGGESELDRTIVDKLGEPLLHLLRNAVDHGIYKNGTIKLVAKREKEFALISVENDGQNIDWQKVIEMAVKKNIISSSEATMLGDRAAEAGKVVPPEVSAILFKGFSTKNEVSETSGRGVGMTIVKKFAESVGGRVIIESPLTSGPGTRFTLELPLTLAIINVLLIETAGHILAIPFGSIERSVSIPTSDIKRLGDREVAVLEGQDVPLSRIKSTVSSEAEKNKDAELVVIVKRGENIAGLVVDKLIEEQEIIVKPLAPILRSIKGFSGSTILGDGKTVLVLDVVSLLENQALLQL